MIRSLCCNGQNKGTPVKLRDGPAAVTRRCIEPLWIGTIVAILPKRNEKVGSMKSGSQKTYRHVTRWVCEGRTDGTVLLQLYP